MEHMDYEDRPPKKYNIVNEGKKMTKKTTEPKTKKVYAPSRIEVFKTVLIAVLITGMISFIAGMNFQSKQQDAIERAVQAVMPSAQAETPVKK